MDGFVHSTLTLPPDPARQFAERWGGYVIAVNFLIASAFMLLFLEVRPPERLAPEPEPIRVMLAATPVPMEPTPEATPEAVSTPVATPPPTAEPPKTTVHESDEATEQPVEVTVEAPATAPPPTMPKFLAAAQTEAPRSKETEGASPSPRQPSEIEMDLARDESGFEAPVPPTPEADATTRERELAFLAELESQKTALKEYNKEIAAKGSDEVADRLQAASLAQKGKKWLTHTDGLREGIIRSLDTSDVPQGVAQQVLERYGIKIMMKMMDGQGGGYNFLNQAKTGGGTYYNRVGRGMYQVFSFGQPAVARMMQLEVEELGRRGYDPAKTRVTEVEFGIVHGPRGYDLGVKRIEVLPIELGASAAEN